MVLPRELQEHGVRCTALATLCVARTGTNGKQRTWSKVAETKGVDVIGHGPLGHTINWHDSLRVLKLTSHNQVVLFSVYIDKEKVGELSLNLHTLLDVNDGSTKITKHQLPKLSDAIPRRTQNSPRAQAYLIVSARARTCSPFCLPGLEPAFTVLNCPIEKLVHLPDLHSRTSTYDKPPFLTSCHDFQPHSTILNITVLFTSCHPNRNTILYLTFLTSRPPCVPAQSYLRGTHTTMHNLTQPCTTSPPPQNLTPTVQRIRVPAQPCDHIYELREGHTLTLQ